MLQHSLIHVTLPTINTQTVLYFCLEIKHARIFNHLFKEVELNEHNTAVHESMKLITNTQCPQLEQ